MLFTIQQFILYYFKSVSKYKVHSPFVYSFIEEILETNIDKRKLKQIKALKKFYFKNNTLINKEDYGAGSLTISDKKTHSLKNIYRNVTIFKKQGKVLYNIVRFYKPKCCIELGTSLAIGSTYLSNNNNQITTIEGNKTLVGIAKKALKSISITNIDIINAKFEDAFETQLKLKKTFDLLFIDGNHTEKATLEYFKIALKYKNKHSIIIFDDIYWSIGMKNAWNTIIKDNEVMLSIDLFKLGIVFFNKDFLTKEHFTIWY